MSLVSNRHNVNLFVSGQSNPLTGQRLAKVGYKSTKANPAKYPSVCASVPLLNQGEILENINGLLPYIREMCEAAQDGIVRSLYESSGGTLTSVSDEEIGIGAIIGYLESQANGGRLTKDLIEGWFDREMKDNLTVLFAEKLGYDLSTPEQEETIGKHLAGYKGLFSSLAGGKTVLNVGQINNLTKALDICAPDDEMSGKLGNRLKQMSQTPKIEELLGL